MTVYLAKFKLREKSAYKFGHTKYYYAQKRFDADDFKKFDKIDILDQIRISDESAKIARDKAKLIEACLLALFPKNFLLESYFNQHPNFFDGLSGITEMFVLKDNQTEEQLITVFKSIKTNIIKLHASSEGHSIVNS